MGLLFTKLIKLFMEEEHKVIVVGLDNAGKTTILYHFFMWDIGGQDSLRTSWSTYFADSDFVIFVVDSTDRERLHISKDELSKMLSHEDLQSIRLLVLANK